MHLMAYCMAKNNIKLNNMLNATINASNRCNVVTWPQYTACSIRWDNLGLIYIAVLNQILCIINVSFHQSNKIFKKEKSWWIWFLAVYFGKSNRVIWVPAHCPYHIDPKSKRQKLELALFRKCSLFFRNINIFYIVKKNPNENSKN